MLKTQNVPVVSIAGIAVNFGFCSFVSWAPTFLFLMDGLDIAQSGLALRIWALAGGVGAIVLGWLSDMLSRRILILACGVSAAILAYFYFTSVNSFFVVVGLSAALGLVAYAYWNLLISLVQDSVDPAVIGGVTGLVLNISMIGSIIGPLITTALIMTLGIVWAMIASVCTPHLVQGIVLACEERVKSEAA